MASRDKFRYYVPGRSSNSSAGAPGRLDKVRLNHLLASEVDPSGNEVDSPTINPNVRHGSEETRTRVDPAQGQYAPDYFPQTDSPTVSSSGSSGGSDMLQGTSSSAYSRIPRDIDVVSNRLPEIGAPFDQGSSNRGPYLAHPLGDVHLHDTTLPFRQNSAPDPRYTGHPSHFGANDAAPFASSDLRAMTGIEVPSGREYEPIMLVIFLGAPPYTVHHIRKMPYGQVASLTVEQLLAFLTTGGA